MNILFLMGTYPSYGGVEKVSTVLANSFVAQGYGVSILSFEQHGSEELLNELNNSVELFTLDYPVFSFKNVRLLHKIIKDNNIGVIINQWAVPFYVALLCNIARRGTSCKLITVHHNLPNTNARIKDIEISIEKGEGFYFINKLKLGFVRFVSRVSLRFTYWQTDKYIVLSPSFIPLAKDYMWLKKGDKISYIFNPITIESCKHCLKGKEIIYVGRIENNQKRIFRLIDIWAHLEQKYLEWEFTIIGDGPDRKALETEIVSRDLKNIKIEGFKSPLPFYKRASILLLVSEYEGFPLVLGEAMANGVVPVVLGSFDAVYDIIENGINGVISIPPFSVEEFTSHISKLIESTEVREKMSVLAKKKSELFYIDDIINKWHLLFEELKR